MRTEDIDILELIPQRPPFVLVDRLMSFSPDCSETSYEIPSDCILSSGGKFSEAGLMENIAQSCAARIGYINKFTKNENVKIGMIGAVRNFKVFRLPNAGSVLSTEITTISEVFGITMVEATVRCGEELLASCQMKISLTDKE